MTRLLQVSDSYLGVEPYRLDERTQDVWAAFSAAVDCAIEHEVDILLHCGMLLSEFVELRPHEARLRAELQRLQNAGVSPVLLQTHHDLQALEVDVLLAGEPALHVRGLRIDSDLRRAAETLPDLLVLHGAVRGVGGLDANLPTIEPEQLVPLRVPWIALGGAARMQPVQPNAWYCGQTARVDVRDTTDVGGLVIELDAATRTPRSVLRVTWGDRAHQRVLVEALGMQPALLDQLLAQRVAQLADADRQPVVQIRVQNAVESLDAQVAREPEWLARLRSQALCAQVDWNGQRLLLTAAGDR